MPRSLADLATYVADAIRSYGVNVSPNSRIGQMHRATVNADGTPRYVTADAPDFQIALEATRDFNILGLIFDQVRGDILPNDFQLRLRRLLKDVTLPQDQLNESKGRDEQFE